MSKRFSESDSQLLSRWDETAQNKVPQTCRLWNVFTSISSHETIAMNWPETVDYRWSHFCGDSHYGVGSDKLLVGRDSLQVALTRFSLFIQKWNWHFRAIAELLLLPPAMCDCTSWCKDTSAICIVVEVAWVTEASCSRCCTTRRTSWTPEVEINLCLLLLAPSIVFTRKLQRSMFLVHLNCKLNALDISPLTKLPQRQAKGKSMKKPISSSQSFKED